MNRITKTIALVIVGLSLAVIPVAAVQAVPPGNITAVQDLSEPCGDTTGADVIVTIDGGAPNTMYGAEVTDVIGNRTITDANGDGTIRLDNIGLEDVTVVVSAANHNPNLNIPVEIQCGTGHGKD